MDTYQITLTFIEPILGTVPKNPEVYTAHVQGRAAELGDDQAAEELATVEAVEEKGWTGFHTLDGQPLIYDYLIRGFFKEACYSLRQISGSASSRLTAYKKRIDGLVFIEPRRILLDLNGGEMGISERPLRAQTAQGERVTLARSDTCPPGTSLSFQVLVLGVITEQHLREWLDYGRFKGLGQWRSGGWGRFTYEMEATDDV